MQTNPPHPDAWLQVNVEFPDPSAAEQTGVHHLSPTLESANTRWFLMRKGAWRCRFLLPTNPTEQEPLRSRAAEHLDGLVTAGHISGWTCVVYEPETRAFGGQEAMDAAHTLFCVDTRCLLAFLASGGSDRRKEVSLLLCRTLMRAAGLDHYEQGDVWHRVAATRSLPADNLPPKKIHQQVHRLLSVDPGPDSPHFTTGAFAGFAPWAQAFQTCGKDLARLNTQGRLERGLRGVLAHHVIFHWNRLGLPGPVQALLSHAAARTIFDPETVGL